MLSVGGWGRSCSSWWREVVQIRDGGSDVGGGWFEVCVSKKVGMGLTRCFGSIYGWG